MSLAHKEKNISLAQKATAFGLTKRVFIVFFKINFRNLSMLSQKGMKMTHFMGFSMSADGRVVKQAKRIHTGKEQGSTYWKQRASRPITAMWAG